LLCLEDGFYTFNEVQYKLRTQFGYKFDFSLKLQLLLKQINMVTYFENLIIELYIFYVINTYQI